MSESILTSVKSTLGLLEDYDAFDVELVFHINSTLATLTQLGVGPLHGFSIANKTAIWSDFLPNEARHNLVKQYVGLRTKLLFDPPTPGYVHASFEKIIDELAWRIVVMNDEINVENQEQTP